MLGVHGLAGAPLVHTLRPQLRLLLLQLVLHAPHTRVPTLHHAEFSNTLEIMILISQQTLCCGCVLFVGQCLLHHSLLYLTPTLVPMVSDWYVYHLAVDGSLGDVFQVWCPWYDTKREYMNPPTYFRL